MKVKYHGKEIELKTELQEGKEKYDILEDELLEDTVEFIIEENKDENK